MRGWVLQLHALSLPPHPPNSSLRQVRASNLNELIYKQGQAGVSRASVTLVFDNSDRNLSPHGYEHYNQITVTRQVCTRRCACVAREPPPSL